jgi:peptide/nickel transport system substrate-binding protein
MRWFAWGVTMDSRPIVVHALVALTVFAAACQPAPAAPPAPAKEPAGPATAAPAKVEPTAAPASNATTAKPAAPSRLVVGVTETLESPNPYAHTDSLKFGIWSEAYGTLVRQNFEKNNHTGILAESWAVEDPTTWVFKLRQEAKWSDGTPVTSVDVVHSYDRMANDPASLQKSTVRPFASIEPRDSHTVVFKTKQPEAAVLDYIQDRAVTSKAAFEKLAEKSYTENIVSAGPYMFREVVPDQRLVLVKNPNYWGGPVKGPDEMVYRIMREPEVRVSALLNNELQMAQFVPPHMDKRVSDNASTKILSYDGIEAMFLAMRPDSKPWDNKLVRQAVGYAIDKQAIINGVLQGYAAPLHGPLGSVRYAFSADLTPKYDYNPDRAKELLSQAGFPGGVDVELATPVGRYTQDKLINEAIASMLTNVGIRTKLVAPEWPTMWDAVMKGSTPFYYMGRLIFDPENVRTYAKYGETPRIGYNSPTWESLFVMQSQIFDPQERAKAILEMNKVLMDDAPMQFLWNHKILIGVAKNIEYKPRPDDRLFPSEIVVN